MGTIISKLRKSKTTFEVLDEIDKNIQRLQKFREANQQLRQKVIGKLIVYSVAAYMIGAVVLYFFFMPEDWTYKIYGLLPFLFFPMLVYLLKRCLHWFFVRKISQNEAELQQLRDQRKDILENVMETETYKKAKEILEKFDPETKRKLEEEKTRNEAEKMKPAANPNLPPGIRRRHVPHVANPIHPGSPGVPVQAGRGMSPNVQNSPVTNGVGRGGIQLSLPAATLPRPILPLEKSNLDKLMDYMIGDGASHRYALICQNCYNHNGMALKEEFEYLAFRCAYCRFFNPSRKQRPTAPPLPVSTPLKYHSKNGSGGQSKAADEDVEKDSKSINSNGSDMEVEEEIVDSGSAEEIADAASAEGLLDKSDITGKPVADFEKRDDKTDNELAT